jgi:NAD(P)-dependent dehydrogenase (short-subunit alcohol dehydrogenase family)
MSASLQDRTVLVVGRGSGIAYAATRSIREAGGHVVVAGRHSDALAAVYDDPGVTAEQVDLTDETGIAALAARLGQVDHVVSAASARAGGAVGDLSHDAVLTSFNVKVAGPILLAKHFAPRMPKDGSFVFLSGSSARKPTVGMLAVGATNAAVDALTRTLAVELGEDRKAALFAAREAGSPAHRIGRSEDIAEAVVFALTNTFMTGVSLGIDGGEPLV